MNKVLFTISLVLLLSFTRSINAQTVEVLQKSEFPPPSKATDFVFIEPTVDTTSMEFIARISAKGTKETSNLELLYIKLKQKARELKSNSFKINSFIKDESAGSATLIVDTYYAIF